jgi:hypothetical protein
MYQVKPWIWNHSREATEESKRIELDGHCPVAPQTMKSKNYLAILAL